MSKIILASELTGGFPKITEYLADEKKGGTILIVTTAAKFEGWTPDYESHFLPFENLGYKTEEFDLTGKTYEETEQKLNSADAVYICGGNSFHLLEHMRKSGFADLIHNRIKDGMIYIGSSAGSVVATANIMYASTVDDPSQADLNGNYDSLKFVDYAIIPHMDHPSFKDACEKLHDRMLEKGYKTVALNDDEVILVA